MRRRTVRPKAQSLATTFGDGAGAGVTTLPPPPSPPDLLTDDGAAGQTFRGESLKILFAHRPSPERARVLRFLRERFDVMVTDNLPDTLTST